MASGDSMSRGEGNDGAAERREDDTATFRKVTTPEQRAANLSPYIDPGLVNHRLVQTFIREHGMRAVDEMTRRLPPNTPDWQREIRLDHNYTIVCLAACRAANLRPLSAVAVEANPEGGEVVCSTETFAAAPEIWERPERMSVNWLPVVECGRKVVLEFTTERVRASNSAPCSLRARRRFRSSPSCAR